MVARGVYEFHVSERKRASARASRRKRWTLARLAVSAIALSTAVTTPLNAAAEDLVVGAAVSLHVPLTAIVRDFEARYTAAHVHLSLGASSTLAAQARAGAPLDVFVSADPLLVDRLESEAWLEARSNVARNSILAVAARGYRLESADDLIAPRLRRLAVPAKGVPLGRYAREWLRQRGLLDAVAGRIILTEHARATSAAVESGHADAAIVYVTDARSAGSEITRLGIAQSEQPDILYVAALRSSAGELARNFFDALSDATARAHFTAAGFAAP